MKKTISGFFAVFLLSLYLMIPVYASGNSIPDSRQYPRLVDYADILSENEEKELLEALDEISERQQVDVVIATAVALNGRSIEATADDFFDYLKIEKNVASSQYLKHVEIDGMQRVESHGDADERKIGGCLVPLRTNKAINERFCHCSEGNHTDGCYEHRHLYDSSIAFHHSMLIVLHLA